MTVTKAVILVTLSLLSFAFAAPSKNARIFGGQTAEPGQFPFMVSLNFNLSGITNSYGGGTIIHKRWVLTTASSFEFFPVDNFYIFANTTSLNSTGTNFLIDSLVIHPEFDNATLTNDIALLKIQGEFEDNQIIEIDEAESNETCTVLGWGTTETTDFPNELQFATLSALSDEDCTRLAEGSEFNFSPNEGEICALASKGVAPCVGDAGGPLVCHDKLVGVLSFFLKMCAAGLPDVYMKVKYYKEWIDSVINK